MCVYNPAQSQLVTSDFLFWLKTSLSLACWQIRPHSQEQMWLTARRDQIIFSQKSACFRFIHPVSKAEAVPYQDLLW